VTPWDLKLAAVHRIPARRRASRLSTGLPWGIGPQRKGFGCRDTPVVAGRQPRGRRGSTWWGLRLGWSYDSSHQIYVHSACCSSTHRLPPTTRHHLLTVAYLHSPRAASCWRATASDVPPQVRSPAVVSQRSLSSPSFPIEQGERENSSSRPLFSTT
jgi:hypothetical protein